MLWAQKHRQLIHTLLLHLVLPVYIYRSTKTYLLIKNSTALSEKICVYEK